MKNFFFLFMLLLITVSCEQSLENQPIDLYKTNLIGDWTVNAYIDNKMIYGPFTISTQTTLENEAITIKDNGEFWKFQTKAELVNSGDFFETQFSVNEISSLETHINILDGSIIGNDSITFEIQFEDDEIPYGFTYKIIGHRK